MKTHLEINTENVKNKNQGIKGIPNVLTILRIILIPVFIYAFSLGNSKLCSAIFVISGITDVCDGYIARRFGAESNLGKILDPIADKLTYATVFFCLLFVNRIPLYFVILFVINQLFQGIGAIAMYRKDNIVVKSNLFGKIAGFSMFTLSVINLVFYEYYNILTITNILCILVLAIIIWANLGYLLYYFKIHKTSKIIRENSEGILK